MKILLTGSGGLFGENFLRQTQEDKRFVITGFNLSSGQDITDRKKTLAIIKKIGPEIIIHAASIGSVDYCEKFKEEAWQVNVEGTRNIILAAQKTGAKLIFLSSNAVYEGKNPPYSETSPRKPVDFYGKTKMVSENDVKKSKIFWVIVRLMTMYGWHNVAHRKNPVTWIIDSLKSRKELQVVDDVFNNHLYVSQAIDCILKIIKINNWKKSYNLAGSDIVSRYQLALLVANVFALDKKLIKPVSSGYFSSLAPRAKNTSFCTDKMKKELGIEPLTIETGLRMMKKEKNNL